MHKRQEGFSHVLLIVLLVIAIGGATWVVWRSFNRQETGHVTKQEVAGSPEASSTDCQNGLEVTEDIIDFDRIEQVTPPGSIIGGHWKTHAYYNFTGNMIKVVAPADITLVDGTKYVQDDKVQYTFSFDGPCNYKFMYDHISEPVPEIAGQFPGEPSTDSRSEFVSELVEFKAGEKIAITDGNGVQRQFDFGVYDMSQTNGLENDPEYKQWIETGSWKYTNAVCPFDLYPSKQMKKYYDLFGTVTDSGVPKTFCSRIPEN